MKCTELESELQKTSIIKSLHPGPPHLVQVAVAPHLPVHKGAGEDAALGVELGAFAHAAALEPHQLASGGVGDVDHSQTAAGLPDGRPALNVVGDAQRELTVVVVDLLCARVTVKVDGEQVAAMCL